MIEKPNTKVTSAGLGGALAVILVWVLEAAGLEVPSPVAAAFAVVCAFLAGYIIREG